MQFHRQSAIALMNYIHISLGGRYQIYALKKAKHSIRFIVDELNQSPSIISKETRHNISLRDYQAKRTDDKAKTRHANNAFTIISNVLDWIVAELKLQWRPEQMAGVHSRLNHMSLYSESSYKSPYSHET